MRRRLISAAGGACRQLSGRRVLGVRGSQGVRLLSRRLASQGTFVYRDHYGHVMEADLSDYIERAGFFGAHSPELFRYLNATLVSGDWVVDAGANVGLLTSAMAARVGPSGMVWAVEPLPRNVERLRLLKAQNQLEHLRVFPVALAATAATASLRLPDSTGGSAFGSFVATWPSSGTVEVETLPLDELVAVERPDRPLRLIKLDVEGYEAEVLAGAATTLAAWRPLVLCEVHDPLLRAAGSSAEALIAAFAAQGYEPREPFDVPTRSLDNIVTDILFAPG